LTPSIENPFPDFAKLSCCPKALLGVIPGTPSRVVPNPLDKLYGVSVM